MTVQRVLLLGGTGFVGSAIAAGLRQSGWGVPVIAARRVAPGAPNCVSLDILDSTALGTALENVDAVVNCVTGSEDVIVRGAHHLATAAKKARVPVVHLSSMTVYGDVTGLIDEDQPLLGNLGAYSRAKAESDRLLRAALERIVVLRPGIIYGPGSVQWTDRVARWLAKGRLGDLGARGDGACNLVHIDDVVRSVLKCLRFPEMQDRRALNLSLASPPTWNEYFVAFGRALGVGPVRRITARRMQLEAKLAYPRKAAELALHKLGVRAQLDPMGPSYWALWQQDIRLNVRRSEQVFGFDWMDWRAGVARAARASRVQPAAELRARI